MLESYVTSIRARVVDVHGDNEFGSGPSLDSLSRAAPGDPWEALTVLHPSICGLKSLFLPGVAYRIAPLSFLFKLSHLSGPDQMQLPRNFQSLTFRPSPSYLV